MRMRLKPKRGEKHKTTSGCDITFLETLSTDKTMCKVLNSGFVAVIPKTDIALPVIETQDYEKIEEEDYHGD